MSQTMTLAKSQESLEQIIDARMTKLSELVPSSAEMVRLKRAFLMATAKTPRLHNCTNASLMGALVECAQLGLMPGASQEAAIIPFGKDAVFVPMYQGLLKLVYRGAQVAWVKCEVVYEKDQFHYEEDAEVTRMAHTPCEDEDPGPLRAVWLKVKMREEATPMFGYMTRRDVHKHRERSRAYQSDKSSPWHTDPEAMWKKTIVRVYSKFLPKSEDGALTRAVALDEMADRRESQGLDLNLGDDVVPEPETIDHSKSPKLGEKGHEPLRKHLFAFAAEWMDKDTDNHAAIHEIIEPMGYASVNDLPITLVDQVKESLKAAVQDAEVSS